MRKNDTPISAAEAEIVAWLKDVRFRRALLGVSEQDVWKKIEELDGLYRMALKAERARYDALLEQMRAGGGEEP